MIGITPTYVLDRRQRNPSCRRSASHYWQRNFFAFCKRMTTFHQAGPPLFQGEMATSSPCKLRACCPASLLYRKTVLLACFTSLPVRLIPFPSRK